NVDTGAGLERLAWVLQRVHSVFETDSLKKWTAPWGDQLKANEKPKYNSLVHVIADHLRAVTFAIAESEDLVPSNTDRGYVLRRLIRRAQHYALRLERVNPQYYVEELSYFWKQYGNLLLTTDFDISVKQRVSDIVLREAQSFEQTLVKGEQMFQLFYRSMSKEKGASAFPWVVPGNTTFTMYDTYGYPFELTKELAAEKGLTVDEAGFRAEMEKQKERGRAARKQTAAGWEESGEPKGSAFVGYERTTEHATIMFMRVKSEPSKDSEPDVQIALDRTPFYAEAGGQIGDSGVLEGPGFLVKVLDTKKEMGTTLHYGKREWGIPILGEKVLAQVDADRRNAIRRAHTATHLLHAALHKTIGPTSTQAGSLVALDYLRFDFHAAHATPPETLAAIESQVNTWALEGHRVFPHWDVPLDKAKQMGATMLFGEKYGEKVRVMEIEGAGGVPISRELCGGTHLDNTREVGLFKFTNEESIGAGQRRLEAVTGLNALEWAQTAERTLKSLSQALAAPVEKIEEKFMQFKAKAEADEKEIKRLRDRDLQDTARALALMEAEVVAERFTYAMDAATLAVIAKHATAMAPKKRFVLGAQDSATATLIVAYGGEAKGEPSAALVVRQAAPLIKGGGGGKDHFAQAGGKDPSGLDAAIAKAVELITAR
ncbi:MAG: alanine--tRNA ligase-related protein, partial [bacterium]